MESVIEDAKSIVQNLLPNKSKDKYLQVYTTFIKWKEEKKINADNFSEEVMLVYFDSLKGK